VTAPLGEVLWYTPDVEFWAVDRVEVGSPIATAQARHGRRIAIASPVAGTVVEVNELLEIAPHALVFQPYIRGWVARVYADNWDRDSVGLLSGSAGAAEYRERLERSLALSRPGAFAGVLL
jgi:glycine cleavage system H lipoate-binding protein